MELNYMRRALTISLLVICLFVGNLASAEESKLEEVNDRRLRLGVIVPLSGPLAFFGNDYIRAYDLVRADHPEVDRTIRIYWEDSAYDSNQALRAFNKLVTVDKVDVVLSFGGPMLSALAPVAEKRKIPFFATESEKRDCEGRAYCSLFRNEADEWGQATWIILRKLGKSNIGIVKNQNQFMNTFVNAIVRNKSDKETAEILLDLPPEMADLRSSILSLKSKNIDALGVYLLPTSHHGFLDATRSLTKTFLLFGVEEFLVKENNKGFEDFIEGALVVAPYATQTYRDRFESKYGHSGGLYYTPTFYDFVNLLKDTITTDKSLRGIDLVNALHFKGEKEGISGKYSVKVSKEGVYSYSFPIAVYKVSKNGIAVEDVINFSSAS
jgi:ABC-type branched-subunit amino acid transport system substrate-binding protein